MKIKSVVHRGLRKFIESDDASGLPPDVLAKIRRMVSFLQDMEKENELHTIPNWKAHTLTGSRKGTWSLFVTKNWRMTSGLIRMKSRSSISILKTTTKK